MTAAGRAGVDGPLIDLATARGYEELARLTRQHDVLINASGVEDIRLAAVGASVLVEISATPAYLRQLAANADPAATVVLGVGLAPGLSTVLLDSLAASPDDELDLGVLLGTGERHGTAAVEWTVGLVGRSLHEPPECESVPNLLSRRRLPGPGGTVRSYLRADFPDHLLLADRGVSVRSYLAVGNRAATSMLGIVARFPQLTNVLRATPHVGGDNWYLVAVNRRTGQQATTVGRGQSSATAALTVLTVSHAARASSGVATMADLVNLDEATACLAANG